LRPAYEPPVQRRSTPSTECDGDCFSAADLARYVVTFTHGLAVQAASGASRAELLRVAKLALQHWPQ